MADKIAIDADGRKLTYKVLSPTNQMDLMEAAGPSNSENREWMRYARLAAQVTAIDDVPVPFPLTKMAIKNAVEKVGIVGMNAVIEAQSAEIEAAMESAEKNASTETAKN